MTSRLYSTDDEYNDDDIISVTSPPTQPEQLYAATGNGSGTPSTPLRPYDYLHNQNNHQRQQSALEEDILDERRFLMMTSSLGIGRRLSDADWKQIYEMMVVSCRQAYSNAENRLERLHVDLQTEIARCELIDSKLATTHRKVDIFIRHNSADIATGMHNLKLLNATNNTPTINCHLALPAPLSGYSRRRSLVNPGTSGNHCDDSNVGCLGDKMATLMTQYSSLFVQVDQARRAQLSQAVRRRSRDRQIRPSGSLKIPPPPKTSTNLTRQSTMVITSHFARNRQRQTQTKQATPIRTSCGVPSTQTSVESNHKPPPDVVYAAASAGPDAAAVYMKCDVTVGLQCQQVNVSDIASLSTAVSVQVSD